MTMSHKLDPSETCRLLLFEAAPERRLEIEELWQRCVPSLKVERESSGVRLFVKGDGLHVDPKTFEAFWLIGFAAWRSIETYAPTIVLALISGSQLSESWHSDDQIAQVEMDYKALIGHSRSLIQEPNLAGFDWPSDIPQPTLDRSKLPNEQDRAVFDLIHLAIAFAISTRVKTSQVYC